MKKLFLLFALAISGTAMGQTFVKDIPVSYLDLIPKMFAYQEKPYLYTISYDYDNGGAKVFIFDENVEEVRSFNLNSVPEVIDLCNPYNNMSTCRFSQTLFNNDELCEYIVPILAGEERWEGTKGFAIKSETGETLFSDTFSKADVLRFSMLQIDEKIYLEVIHVDYDTYESFSRIYRIDRESSSLQKVKDIQGLNIMPRMPKRHEMVTVEMDEVSDTARKLVVVNAAGQIVDSVIVPAGSKQVQLSASHMSHGLNVIQLKDGAQTSNGYKIFVR